jgi:hypothetical protein
VKRISLAVLFSHFSAPARAVCVAQVKGPSATRQGNLKRETAYLRQSVLCLAAVLLFAGTGSGDAGGVPVTLSSRSVSFSSQIVNTTSSARLISLKNRQSVPLTISLVSVVGDFAQTSNCPLAPATLASGASCVLSITFTPTSLGTRTGTLVVNDDASTSPQSVSLSGTGTLSGLSTITVTPGNASVNAGSQQQFTATGNFSGGLTSNITNVVTWTSSNTVAATVSSTGLASGLFAGNSTIQASSGTITGSATLVVVSTSVLQTITVTPSASSIAKGQTQQFVATGIYSDGSTQNLTSAVTWSSSLQAVTTISSSGLATGAGVGTTTVAATFGTVSGSTTLTVTTATLVSIAVTPANPSIALGTNQQFTATGTYTDGSTLNLTGSVTWISSVPAVATVSNTAPNVGLATSVGTGQTMITASSGSISGSTILTVTPAALLSIIVTPAAPTIPLGSTRQFTATGTYTDGSTQNITTTVAWSSSSPAVATISNAAGTKGLATSVGSGQTTITATLGSVTGSTTLTVNAAALSSIALSPLNSTIALGTTQQFTATGTYTDGSTHNITTTVAWSSSSPTVATISNAAGTNGLTTSANAGQSTITATLGSVTGSTTLTVSAAALSSIALSPLNSSISLGSTQQFTATGTYTDGSTQNITTTVAWSSSSPTVATISNAAGTNGLATSVGSGQTTITATQGSVTSSTTLTVNAAALSSIALSPLNPSIGLGTTQQFTATGTYTDGSTQNITTTVAWSSSSPAVATISNAAGTNGLASSVNAGQSTITATLGSVTGSTTLTVNAAALSSIALSPLNSSIVLGTTQQFTATGTYTNGSTQDLSSSALWSSSDSTIFTVNATGLAASLTTGTATITATANGVSGSTNLTVIPVNSLPTVSCFFQNGVVNGGQAYWGNSVTHDNIFSPRPTEVVPAYQHYGNNAVIFDGPVVHIGTPCVLTSVTYFTGLSPNTDPYQQHFICQGTGATNGQGATVTTTQPVTAGPCAAGDVAVAYTNTYDVGLYCVSNSSGECVYGQLYCNVGPVPYNVAAPGPSRLATFNCKQGVVALPAGDYGVMMATNCDTGSVAGPNGVGASSSGGDKPCLTGMGESGPFGGGALNNAFQYGAQIYAWKYFTFNPLWDNRAGHCLLYDPLHDNTIGLPPSLTAYDNGGCSMVNTGQVKIAPSGQAPHTIGFTWWSTQ